MGDFCIPRPILFLILTISLVAGVYSSATFTIVNKCEFTVWPGILSNAGIPSLPVTGFILQSGGTKTINAPSSWGGRFWGRTHCSQDSSGKFSCLTGDCGSRKLECTGEGAPPATLAEFTLNGAAGKDFYDVSLVDGYNLPMLIVPQGGAGANCTNTGCIADLLNGACPSELRVMNNGGEGVACRSACDALQKDQYCCRGAYGTPDACKPTQYSQAFKNACPLAYSYAYDDSTSTFTCTGADYTITFCPSPNTSKKSSSEGQSPESDGNKSPVDSNMVYEGALEASGASRTCAHVMGVLTIGVAATVWWLCHLF